MRPKLGHTLADTKIQSVKDVCALFGRKESNFARRANTARLRAITIKEHSARSPQLRYGCPLSRTCRTSATKSPLGLFKEISPKRNFFQGAPPARVRPLCAFGANSPTPALSGRTRSFALCGARVGAPPRHPASLREGLTQALLLVTHQNLMST